jgi:hypothetical protein
MSDPTIAFQRQPLEILARGGETVSEPIIHALTDWVRSDWTAHVVSHSRNRLYVLAAPATPLRVVVIARQRARHTRWLDVCAVDDAEADDLMAYFEPLAELDHLSAIMEVKLGKLDPVVIARVVESLDPAFHLPHHGLATPYGWRAGRGLYQPTVRLLNYIDSNADRWATSKARSHFKTLLDEARERPQVVGRDGDDLVIISRRYLQETVEPTSAKALSRRYLGMGLSDDDMPVLEHGTLPPLEDLPPIGPP